MKFQLALIMGLGALSLTACDPSSNTSTLAAGAGNSGPDGAPAPNDPNQELVDLKGCRWWVVSKPSGLQWERVPGYRADCEPKGASKTALRQSADAPPRIDTSLKAETTAADTQAANIEGNAVTINDLERAPPALAPKPDPEPEPEPTPEPSPEPEPEVTHNAPLNPGALYIQAATFRSAANARDTAKNLRADGYGAILPDAQNANFHRVVIGPFETQIARRTALKQLRTKGYIDAYSMVQ